MAHVTVPDLPARVQISVGSTPSTGPFLFDFTFFATGDIKVYKGTTLLTEVTDYTVTGDAGTDAGYEGGYVTLVVAASNTTLTIVRDIPIERVSDLPDAGSFNRRTLNTTLDKYVAMMRQLEDALARGLLVPITDPTSLDMSLPAQATRATKVLAFDADGEPVASTQSLATLEAGATAAAASAAAALASQIAALAAQAAAEAVYDSFDDRYLGAKAADPSVDNDGNALAAGAIYYQTVGNKFRYWNGSAWADAFPSGTIPIGSGGTGQTTADAAIGALVAALTVNANPSINDKIPYRNAADSNGRYVTFQQAFNAMNGLTSYTALNAADEMMLRDGSGGGNGARKMTIANFLLGTGRQGRNIAGRNGGLEVWQRGTSISVPASTTAYTADGWALKTNANQASTVTRAARGAGSQYAALVQRNSGQTGVGTMSFEFPLDTDEILFMQGKVVTLSLDLAAGANWSPTSGNLTIELRTGTGTAAKRSAGAYTGDAAPISNVQALTPGGAYTRVSFTSAALGASITQASIYLTWTPTGTAGVSDWLAVDDVQLEVSPIATPFERRPFFLELLACERHYEKSYDYGTALGASTTNGSVFLQVYTAAAATDWMAAYFRTRKRVAPTVTLYSTTGASGNVRSISGAVDVAATAVSVGEDGFTANFTSPAAMAGRFHYTADAGI